MIEVCFAAPDKQWIIELHYEANSTVREIILAADILQHTPYSSVDECDVGIFSKRVSLETIINDGDRIEIYRPLTADPKQRRRNKVQK